MYTKITMTIGKKMMGMNGEKNKVSFRTKKYKELGHIPAMNYRYTEEDLYQIGYEKWFDGNEMITSVVVPAGEEDKGKERLKTHATEYFEERKNNMDELITLVSPKKQKK